MAKAIQRRRSLRVLFVLLKIFMFVFCLFLFLCFDLCDLDRAWPLVVYKSCIFSLSKSRLVLPHRSELSSQQKVSNIVSRRLSRSASIVPRRIQSYLVVLRRNSVVSRRCP